MSTMKPTELRSAMTAEDLTELEATITRTIKGLRDPMAMERAAERMDRMREEMRLRVGVGDWAVPLTRETRDEQ